MEAVSEALPAFAEPLTKRDLTAFAEAWAAHVAAN